MKGYNFGRRLLEINGMAKLLILKLQQNLTRYKAFHCVINFRRKRNVLKRKVEENHQTSQTNVPIGILRSNSYLYLRRSTNLLMIKISIFD